MLLGPDTTGEVSYHYVGRTRIINLSAELGWIGKYLPLGRRALGLVAGFDMYATVSISCFLAFVETKLFAEPKQVANASSSISNNNKKPPH